MYEQFLTYLMIPLLALASFMWVFIVLFALARLTKKPLLEETKPQKIFLYTILLVLVAIICMTPFFREKIEIPLLTISLLLAAQLIINYIILAKLNLDRNTVAIYSIGICIFTNYFLLEFIAKIWSTIIDNLFFSNLSVNATYASQIPHFMIFISSISIILLILYFNNPTSLIRDWEEKNSKKFKKYLHISGLIFFIILLATMTIFALNYLELSQEQSKIDSYANPIIEIQNAITNSTPSGELTTKEFLLERYLSLGAVDFLAPESIIFTKGNLSTDFKVGPDYLIYNGKEKYKIISAKVICKQNNSDLISSISNLEPKYDTSLASDGCFDKNSTCCVIIPIEASN